MTDQALPYYLTHPPSSTCCPFSLPCCRRFPSSDIFASFAAHVDDFIAGCLRDDDNISNISDINSSEAERSAGGDHPEEVDLTADRSDDDGTGGSGGGMLGSLLSFFGQSSPAQSNSSAGGHRKRKRAADEDEAEVGEDDAAK